MANIVTFDADISFERPYLIKGLNIMIPTFAKSTDFGKNHGFPKTVAFRIRKNRGFLCETKDHLPRKVTPFLISYVFGSFKTDESILRVARLYLEIKACIPFGDEDLH